MAKRSVAKGSNRKARRQPGRAGPIGGTAPGGEGVDGPGGARGAANVNGSDNAQLSGTTNRS